MVVGCDFGCRARVGSDCHPVWRLVLFSPWSVSLTGEYRFEILRSASPAGRNLHALSCLPPSSDEVLECLSSFCALHNLHSQYLAALATTLTFPCTVSSE